MISLLNLLNFQKRFISNAIREDIDCAVLVMDHAVTGKIGPWQDTLSRRILDPDDELFRPGTESVLVSGSASNRRESVFRFAREDLEPSGGGYSFTDSHTRIGIQAQTQRIPGCG